MRLNYSACVVIVVLCSAISLSAMAFEPCRIKGYAHELECQTVQVDKFMIKVYRMASVVRYPLSEPIVWIPSGLGVNVSRVAAGKIRALRRIRTHQDLIWLEVLDKDGQPWLRCRSVTDNKTNIKSIESHIDHFSDPTFVQQCHSQISQWGLTAFSAESVAKGYEAIRKALNYEKVVVFADGNGAKVALAWQRQAPDAIKFQVFDNPPPLTNTFLKTTVQTQARFLTYRDACLQSTSCSNAYGDAQEHLRTIISRLPQSVTIQDPLTGKHETLTIAEPLFYLALTQVLSSTLTASQMPKVLAQVASGDWSFLFGLLSLGWGKYEYAFNDAAFLAQYCLNYDGGQSESYDEKNWFYQTGKQRVDTLCQPLSIPAKTGEAFSVNDVPTLVLNSGPSLNETGDWSFLTQKTTINAPHAIGNLIGYGCTKDVIYRYFKKQRKHATQTIRPDELNASCVESVPLPTMEVLH